MTSLNKRSGGFYFTWAIFFMMGCGDSAASGKESDEPNDLLPGSDSGRASASTGGGPSTGGALAPGPGDLPPSAVGAPCIQWDESSPYWSSASSSTTSLEHEHEACESQLCLSNQFQGRVTCPYGQTDATPEEERCRTPDGSVVEVPVSPQLVSRRSWDAVHCSCRCDGVDQGASYCTCPDFMMCVPLITPSSTNESFAGSYCVYKDFSSEWQSDVCHRSLSNCEEAP